ncbi:MAG: SIMPL domain-containing protein [Phascolarctobacterium sp.]|uniref:SIMPL domain-containing protein n=1 Tax=Phascolarctobacterium sp. TaxID=2049039 RepID=UPI0026DD37B6|nr:SIMPL domain-containing protein [Phascolarctobacterium sp.]MDO4922109.1 SIMPL domain-containing protein [Phascolarctobacterium sp.]
MYRLRRLCMALLVMCLTMLGSAAVFAAENIDRVTVNASATMEVAPDTAYLYFAVEGRGDKAADAVAEAANKMEAVRRSLLGLNIVGDSVSTTSYSLNRSYDNKGRADGYVARNAVRVKVTDVAKVGGVIDKISGAGVDNISNINFTVSESKGYRNQLLAQAVENARQQAAVLANAGGRSLGRLVSASVHNINGFERSYPIAGNMMLKTADMSAGEATRIETQNIKLTASVETVFAMQ